MPFYEGFVYFARGLYWWLYETYCQTDTTASDYGKCYQRVISEAIGVPLFTYTGTTAPSCVNDNTCIGIQNPPWDYPVTLKDNTSIGKQLILYKTWMILNSNGGLVVDKTKCGRATVKTNAMEENLWFPFMFKTANYVSGSGPNAYNPLDNSICGLNVFYTPPVGSQIVAEWNGATLAMKIIVDINMRNQPNIYYALYAAAYYAQESSPYAIIPLDYNNDYVPYRELRNAFGYSYNGVDQPGWNAQDMISALKDIFPDRSWAVFDDNNQILYLYNLTPDYVPDWLIEKLSPTAMKVLQPPADATVAKAWLDLLNERNAQIPPQAELP